MPRDRRFFLAAAVATLTPGAAVQAAAVPTSASVAGGLPPQLRWLSAESVPVQFAAGDPRRVRQQGVSGGLQAGA